MSAQTPQHATVTPPRLRSSRGLADRLSDAAGHVVAQYGLLVVFALLVAAFSIAKPETFFTTQNAQTIAAGKAVVAVLALSAMVPLIVGQFDLSLGFQMGLAQTLCAGLILKQHESALVAVLLTLLVGVLFGLANGLLVVRVKINAFIATLGTALILDGLIQNKWDGPAGGVPTGFSNGIGYTRFGAIPVSIFIFAAVAVLVWFLLRYTRFGYRVYAVGGSEDVSKLSGLRTHRTIIAAHIVCSLAAVTTGIFLAARLKAGTPTVGTDGGYDLESIAAVVLGGTALSGGRGGVIGTVGGVFILAVLDNTFNQLELNAFLKDVVRGIIIIAAVAVYARRQEKKA